MTLDEFLARLEKTPREWGFRYGIRLRLDKGYHCPISAVAGAGYDAGNYDEAAAELGIDRDLALKIVQAADGELGCEPLRQRLLVACGVA